MDKDAAIAALTQKCKRLENVLFLIDTDVNAAARQYLKDWKPAFPGEKLRFNAFLAILQGEVTRRVREEWEGGRKDTIRQEIERQLIQDFEDRFQKEIIGNKLSVVVYMGPEELVQMADGRVRRRWFRASCLQRSIMVEDASKEDIARKWVHRLRSKLVKGPITRFAMVDSAFLNRLFAEGVLLDEVKVGPFDVTIKGHPAEVFTKSQENAT